MSNTDYSFSLVDYGFSEAFARAKAAADAVATARSAHRVRIPLSGIGAALYSRFDARNAARVERMAQVAFERGWV